MVEWLLAKLERLNGLGRTSMAEGLFGRGLLCAAGWLGDLGVVGFQICADGHALERNMQLKSGGIYVARINIESYPNQISYLRTRTTTFRVLDVSTCRTNICSYTPHIFRLGSFLGTRGEVVPCCVT